MLEVFFFNFNTERGFFRFILSVLTENKTGCMSNRKMNPCLGCRVVRRRCVRFLRLVIFGVDTKQLIRSIVETQ